jgi:hypothetical protein
MRVAFVGLDARVRRWYPKVAEGAARGLNVLLETTEPRPVVELWAEFDATQDSVVRVVEREEGKQVFEVVIFAAAAWKSAKTAVPDAVKQLAAVLLGRPGGTGPVRRVLAQEVKDLPAVARSRIRHPWDLREHFTLVAGEALDVARFLELLDGLEQQLQTEGVGEVTGSGFGVEGWSCDLASRDRQTCLTSAISFLQKQGLAHVRILE